MFSLLLAGILLGAVETVDSTSLDAALVVAARDRIQLGQLASPGDRISGELIARHGILRPNSLSAMVPGLYIPDYGASLTSTIYMRGLGSRMENPSLALYIDDIPVLDKNAYDFDWSLIRGAELLRGPQGTLYGRNSMGGVLSLHTLSARDGSGLSASLEAGTAKSLRLGLSYAFDNHFLSVGYRHSDGFFPNVFTGRNCDPYDGGQLHWKWDASLSDRLSLSHSLMLNASNEGGFAYGHYLEGKLRPVEYNDEGSYRRLSLIDGTKLQHRGELLILDAAASLQLLLDRMRMDQDYLPLSIFTLEQRQGSGTLTGELILRPAQEFALWKPATGAFTFVRRNRMNAPVLFKEDGIRTLILDNANRNIPEWAGWLDIPDKEFPVASDFTIWTWNAALFHESVFSLGRWTLTAGLRLDLEYGSMDYDSEAGVNYQFHPTMAAPKPFRTDYRGRVDQLSFVLLPKLSALYELPLAEDRSSLSFYGNVTRGFRAGGFNTQIFSDILQGKMMNGLMADLGVYLDNPTPSVGAEHTLYRPETAWNYELGIRFRDGKRFKAELNAYRIDCMNQQLTVFPPGKSIGRMMTNAGRSRSLGVEAEADLLLGAFQLRVSYSWCSAQFLDYHDGNADYAGNRVPYVPEHTLYAGADYTFILAGRPVTFGADVRGAGPFRWDEANTLQEPFSATLGAMASVTLGKVLLYLRGENLTDLRARSFYFKTIGNEFFALSKPRRIAFGINYNF